MKIRELEKLSLSVQETANYLGISEQLVHRDYPLWDSLGVRIYRYNLGKTNRAKVLINKQDIDSILMPRLLIRKQGGGV